MYNIEDRVIKIYRELIGKKITRERADKFAYDLRLSLGDEFEQSLMQNQPDLYDLVSALELVLTPDEDGGWLYDTEDFRLWLEEYLEKHNTF